MVSSVDTAAAIAARRFELIETGIARKWSGVRKFGREITGSSGLRDFWQEFQLDALKHTRGRTGRTSMLFEGKRPISPTCDDIKKATRNVSPFLCPAMQL
ncbi:hypothetical protein [Paraburkholderia antibiotica]|uniref:Uncharacterized protein n=1 Tax=Paraburkholderia antibiotica TaxID=2728839 RepID=A0A7Y0A1B0_9BURK|nr:hypothetical protein [Paraburkholderia antibiotica]NML34619.1 hypothetical protein [Paraburkholderia antibiotica]